MGGGQNEGNYGIEVIAKPTGLYQIQKLKNFIFYILGGSVEQKVWGVV